MLAGLLLLLLLLLSMPASAAVGLPVGIPGVSSSMKRLVMVQLSSEEATRRIRIPSEHSATYGALEAALRDQLADTHAAAAAAFINITKVEFYDDLISSFRVYDSQEVVKATLRFVTCCATVAPAEGSGHAPATHLIRGRAFDIAAGLPLAGRVIAISDGEDRSQGTGLNTWDGSVVLAKYLERHPALLAGRRVLELGSGTGLAGIAAGVLGARVSVLTDLQYTLANLELNVRNNLAGTEFSETVLTRALDWGNAQTYIFPNDLTAGGSDSDSSAEIVVANGTESDALPIQQQQQQQQWDVILGADVVWVEELVPLLVGALKGLCGADTRLLLAHQVGEG
jgi:predicted nicotinamide N-methyase